MADVDDYRKDMEAFFKMAKYPLVRQTDMSAEMREEAVDVCVTAVEKHQTDMEKCTQVARGSTIQQQHQIVFCMDDHMSMYA